MLGQPVFLLGLPARQTQGHALLAQQHVAAVTRADAHDRVVFGEVQDQAAIEIQVGLGVVALGEFAV